MPRMEQERIAGAKIIDMKLWVGGISYSCVSNYRIFFEKSASELSHSSASLHALPLSAFS